MPRALEDATRGLQYPPAAVNHDRFEALLAPLAADEFFDRHWEREPAHLVAPGARFEALVTHAELVDALVTRADDRDVMAFGEHLAPRCTTRELLDDRARLEGYFSAGHALVWNRAHGLTPLIDATARALADALDAHVWPNVYATGTAGTAFDAHFDCHEVFAVQCEGEKRWWVSAQRENRPLDVPPLAPSIAWALANRRERALARTAMEFTAAPGDVVYLPRGQWHNASTPRGRSLHVTFGVERTSGYGAMRAALDAALGEAVMREYLPVGDGAAQRAMIEQWVERARGALTVERVEEAVTALRAQHRAAVTRGGTRG